MIAGRGSLVALALIGTGCPIEGTIGVYRAADGGASDSASATSDAVSEPTGSSACGAGEDGSCAECLRGACCELLPGCAEPSACRCMFDCITAGTPAPDCADECNGDNSAKEFSMCAMKECASNCGGSGP